MGVYSRRILSLAVFVGAATQECHAGERLMEDQSLQRTICFGHLSRNQHPIPIRSMGFTLQLLPHCRLESDESM